VPDDYRREVYDAGAIMTHPASDVAGGLGSSADSSSLPPPLSSAKTPDHREGQGLPIPPAGLVLFGMLTVQFGAAIAKSLFAQLGPGGVVFLRVVFAALVLMALWRPWRGLRQHYTRADVAAILAFGFVFAMMNFTFYVAIDRVPLGVAVTLEFVGPLGVAVAGSRRLLDVVWVTLAAAGLLLFAPIPAGSATPLDPIGLGFALLTGVFWACYILLSSRVGKAAPGGGGLALSLTVGAIALLPVGIFSAGSALLRPQFLLVGAAVALLSSIIPYSMEFVALRRMSTGAFGVLMSLEPGIATLVGLLVLHEGLTPRGVLALLLVTIAALGATRTGNGAA
jgi:inner membrane transporter RhtA